MLAGALLAADTRAQQEEGPIMPAQLSRTAEAALGRFQEFVDNQDWSGAALMLSRILARAPQRSFDAAMSNAVLAQVYLQRGAEGDTDAAIAPLEAALESNFFQPQQELDWMYLLAQLHVQAGNRRRGEELMSRWMERSIDPSPEGVIFYATLLVDRAQSGDPAAALLVLEEAYFHIERGMVRIPEPPEMYYFLQAACLQGLERFDETAEVLEWMVAQRPDRADYWEHLYSMYAADQRNLRALLTIERAQEHGFMLARNDQFNRVSHYYNLGRYEKVIELLDAGLPEDTTANAEAMWALLGFACQQTDRIARAIEVYLEAGRRYQAPKYELMAANLLYSEGRKVEALAALEAAFGRGPMEDPLQPLLFAAYIAYELREPDRALSFLEAAEPELESDRDRRDFAGLKAAIEYVRAEPPPHP
jgi:tetratricopeptide (TPR) repeat protein